MAWDEWEQLKAETAERHTAHMQINSVPVDGGYGKPSNSGTAAGNPDLRITDAPWLRAAGVAQELQTSMQRALTALRDSDEGVGGGTEGFTATAALREIQPTWEKRLGAVRDECDRLHGTLEKTGKRFGETDDDVRRSVDGVRTPSRPGWLR
ncbi:hypothetical protein OIB37_30040 [Streptomyces sp. NBC_00820]|uniref:hypothetical protein n=1 Tax=Streptomyces sp. NBC_00820 TaxID=2975842 RepID=UPI002ED3B456|nr:hypothetical protein OIB37_30040 [Streptomyces sp. NBC_00820]